MRNDQWHRCTSSLASGAPISSLLQRFSTPMIASVLEVQSGEKIPLGEQAFK